MESRCHGDGRFKLAVEARHEHVGLLFGNSKRSKRSRNTREGEVASHHDIAVRSNPMANIIATHKGEVRRPLGMLRNFSMTCLTTVFVSGKGFPHFPSTTIEATALAIHFNTFFRELLVTKTIDIIRTRKVTRIRNEKWLMLGPRIRTFPYITAIQTVIEHNHILTRINLAMLGILEVKITTIEARFQLKVDTGQVRGVAEGSSIEVSFVLAPTRETRRICQGIRRVKARLEEHKFSSHRPTFNILALSFYIKADFRISHARTVAFLARRVSFFQIRNEYRRIRDADTHISHQEKLRSNVTLDIGCNHMSIEECRSTIFRISYPLIAEFIFIDSLFIEGHTHVVYANRKVISNLFWINLHE